MRRNNWKKGITIIMAGLLVLGHITNQSIINATNFSGSQNQEVTTEKQESTTENQESIATSQDVTTERQESITENERENVDTSEEQLNKTESDESSEETLIQVLDAGESGSQAAIPKTFSELNKYTTYMISSNEGWLRLQNICNEDEGHSLEEYKFVYTVNSADGIEGYDFSQIEGFTGIGAKVPFAGELDRSYETSIPLSTDKPIFVKLSSKASIQKMDIKVSSGSAGLANTLVMDNEAEVDSILNLTNISITGTVDSDDTSGGLFAEVINSTDHMLTIVGNSVNLNNTEVHGKVAGGLIGSISGNVTLQLNSGITWAPVTKMKADVTANASIGGLIGKIKNEVSDDNSGTSKSNVIINGTGIVYNEPVNEEIVVTGNRGGIIGSIENAVVTFGVPVTYNGKTQDADSNSKANISNEKGPQSLFDLRGEIIGALAGTVENSTITLNNAFSTDNIWMEYKNSTTEDVTIGVGGLIGVMKNSSLNANASIEVKNLRVLHGNTTPDYKGSIGGLIGSMYDSYINSSNNCSVESFETYETYGTTGGGIGFYQVTDGLNRNIARITAENLDFITSGQYNKNQDKKNYVGGLIGNMELGSATVKISNCYVNNMKLRAYNVASLGVGQVVAESGGKLIMENTVCISMDKLLRNGEYDREALEYFGGAIGIANADFEIIGNELQNGIYSSGYAGNTNGVNGSNQRVIFYTGGLIGKVENTNNNKIRKGTVQNVIIGGDIYGQNTLSYEAFGGLFGATAEGVSICLDGTIEQNGGSVTSIDGNSIDLEAQKTSLKQKNIGSVVGIINNSLIYLEKGATLNPSQTYTCNEIGNYGGVIRNDIWDEQELLIQDHKVTGKLEVSENDEYTIDTTADLVRLAIALNTQGEFLPSGNFNDSGNPDVSFDDLNKATYNITVASIDLTDTGVVCLNRNDENGSPFQGSLIGEKGNTTIKNTVNSYSQSWIGLFSRIKGKQGEASEFKNLSLEYSVLYEELSSSGVKRSDMQYFAQGAGGLAAVAEGDITVESVSYSGKIQDENNDSKYLVEEENGIKLGYGQKYYNGADYFGGIFGEYKLLSGEKLTMNDISVKMDEFSFKRVTHVFGGMIAYVNLDDIKTEKKTVSTDIDLKNIMLSGEMSIICANSAGGWAKASTNIVRSGSFIALIGNASTGEDYEKKCDISVQNLTVDTVELSTPYENSNIEMGGFWGYKWTDAWITISSTGENKNVVKNSKLQSSSLFGGLVNTVYGKMSLEDFSFVDNVTINTINANKLLEKTISKNADEVNCGLLVRDGRYLYLTVKDYTGTNIVTLQNYGQNCYFDELVGFNRGGNDDKHGGIVSIEQSGENGTNILFLGRNNNSYTSYSDGMNTRSNPNTRYYYDLSSLTYPTSTSTGESGTGNAYSTLDSPEDIMAWHLMHYANSQIRTCLDPNFEGLPSNSKYIISGNIDMQGYSIYPTHSMGEKYTCTGASITFHAAEIIVGEKEKTEGTSVAKKYPENAELQHYQMQSGLFDTVAGITVEGLTLKGTYSQVQHSVGSPVDYAGALICGTIYGIELEEKDSQGKTQYNEDVQNTICNIVMDNLWCVSSFESENKNYVQPLGLMIADISSGAKVTFDKISMRNYDTSSSDVRYPNYTVSEYDKAASSLIGNVGGKDARCITLKFTNLDLADVATEQSSANTKSTMADEALAMSSVIYSYEYAEKCNAIYTFNYEDYTYGTGLATSSDNTDKYVTLGIELGIVDTKGSAEVEYYDTDLSVGRIKTEDNHITGIDYDENHFIPYVYTYDTNLKNLTVNPKVGHLTKGCGTYEDPYVISSTKQLLTLYRYLYKESDYEDILKANEWQVNEVGYDDTFCTRAESHKTCTYGATNDDTSTFPNKARLSQAYYLINDDIDLSKDVEFAGFGSAEQPFIGVFVGRKSDNSQPVIKMSQQTAPQPAYGFIQYAKGCVIKDLTFQYDSTVPIAAEGGIGGGVIASVLGGDNILDNVTVKGNTIDPNNNGDTEIIPCFEPKDTDSIIGGYVGVVELGGVIIRNMQTNNLVNFKVCFGETESDVAPTNAELIEKYILTNGIIGKVKDGYVLDENSQNNSETAVNAMQYPDNAQLPASRSYDIVNKLYLDKMILEDPGDSDNSQAGKIVWQNKQYDIKGAAQLQVMSMALNAGMLNYKYGQKDFGYSNDSRTRCGAYDEVGTVISANDDDYAYVTKYDNWNNKSPVGISDSNIGFFQGYLMQYFDFIDSILYPNAAYSNSNVSAVLNPNGLSTNLENAQTYYLSTNNIYDLSVYGTAFRGFGARYNRTENVFHSHMKGYENGNTVVNVDMLVDGIQDAEDVAFLNTVSEPYVTKANLPLMISDITLTGRVINAEDIITTENGTRTINVTRKEQESTHNAAGWISKATGFIKFSNVYLKNIDIQSQSFAGGYIAKYESSGLPTFVNCGIQSNESETTVPASFESINYSNKIEGVLETGGFIGWINSTTAGTMSFSFEENTTDTNILESVRVHSYGKYWALDTEDTITQDTKELLYNTGDMYQPATGGLIGRLNGNSTSFIEINGVDLTKVSIQGDGGNAGGLIGFCNIYVLINGDAENDVDENAEHLTECQWLSVESGGQYIQTGGLIGALKQQNSGNTSKICSVFLNNLSVKNTYNDATLNQKTSNETWDNVIATAGVIGVVNNRTRLINVDIGSEMNGTVLIKDENQENEIPIHTSYAAGGFLGRCMSGHQMTMTNCGIYGRKDGDNFTTVISAVGNSGAIASNIRVATCTNIEVKTVKVESARFIGGLCGYKEAGSKTTLTNFTLEASYLVFTGNGEDDKDDGDIGGIVGRTAGEMEVNDVNIIDNRIDSDYCENAGGLAGRMEGDLTINKLNASSNNLIQGNLICGRTVGGVTAFMKRKTINIKSGIIIQNNKLISSLERTEPENPKVVAEAAARYNTTFCCAGGVAGFLGSESTAYAEDVIIRENLISGYYDQDADKRSDVQPNVSNLGGVIGQEKGKLYFYHTDLQNNYIGEIHKDELTELALTKLALTKLASSEETTEEDLIDLRKKWLWEAPIITPKETNQETPTKALRDMLYYISWVNNYLTYDHNISKTSISQESYYQYCYLHGAVVGIRSSALTSSYIRTNIYYTDDKYRPVSDVGCNPNNKYKIKDNNFMYTTYRTDDVIVYDGYDTKVENNSFETYFGTSPYPFGNLETIWSDYLSSKSVANRNAFLLNENYQKNAMQELSVETVLNGTYKDVNGNYLSDYQIVSSSTDSTPVTLPMVVYRSNESGNIDDVIQTYINMITNNSGALNSSVGVITANNEYLIDVKTTKYNLINGKIIEATDKTSCISVTSSVTGNYKRFEFSLNGYDQFVDSQNGSFSGVTVQYRYGNEVKWEFEIPVYVEPMLQTESHMSMLEGIQYDIDAIKENGTQSNETSNNEKILSSGNSYSLYLEYIYGETRKHYPNAEIPKQFYMEDYNEHNVSEKNLKFMPGTRLTLIAIDEGSRPYYYTVTGEETDKILFTDFKDGSGANYALKNINNGCPKYEGETTYTDLHNNELQEVAVEQYLIIVDLSEASARNNSKYRLRVTPEALSTSDNATDKVLSERIDYVEHCKVYFNEIPGITYSIDESKTTIAPDSKISNSGKITLNMEYIMKATFDFWSNNKNNPFKEYLDVAIYLSKDQKKIPLPVGTQVQFNNQIYPVINSNTSTMYYYKDSNMPYQITGDGGINNKTDNTPINETLNDIVLDFSNADLSGLENGSDYKICVDLIVTSDPDRPADGDVKASWSANVAMEGKTDIGFALQVKDQRTLGMNGYQPESTDSGVVPYTASIAFPAACRESYSESAKAAEKYYTIVYQVYEKTKSDDKTVYVPYAGENVSIYLGDITDGDSTTGDDTENQEYNSGAGITAVTYEFTQENITKGAILSDGLHADDSATSTPAMIQTNCTLVANRDKLDMTNYKVEAYLLITDEQSYPSSFTTLLSQANGCVHGYKCRSTDGGSSWKVFNDSQKDLLKDAKNDFFIFTVARIKTSMQ